MAVAPAKTPQSIVQKLHNDLTSVLAEPEIKDQIVGAGMLQIDNPSVAGLQDFVVSEIARWGKVVHQAGLAGSQ